MRPDHLDALACCICGRPLVGVFSDVAADGHVMTGTLNCESCQVGFPIHRGVPRVLPFAQESVVARTVEAFGYQWEHAEVLADARFSSAETFLDFIFPVRREFLRGKKVLDGGCGSGRFVSLAAEFGAELVVGIDLSAAVDLAFARTRHLSSVLIVQGDMLHLPLQQVFDYAFSIGVLHHTADPRAAFLNMASKVVRGGGVSAWVYGAENNDWVIRVLNPLRRVTSRLPRALLLALAHVSAVPLTAVVKSVYGPVARRPSLRWLRSRLFYFEYLAFLAQFGYREHVFIIFDHAVPAIAEYIPRTAFAEWFAAAGLQDVIITDRAQNSWRGFGTVAP